MGITTMLCCFIADEEMFPAGQRFADAEGEAGIKQAIAKANEKAHKVDNGSKVHPIKNIQVIFIEISCYGQITIVINDETVLVCGFTVRKSYVS